jgi:hypothetical protein
VSGAKVGLDNVFQIRRVGVGPRLPFGHGVAQGGRTGGLHQVGLGIEVGVERTMSQPGGGHQISDADPVHAALAKELR